MDKELEMFSAALEKANTAQEITQAVMSLSTDPKFSTTEQPTTLQGLVSAIETEKTADGSEKAPT